MADVFIQSDLQGEDTTNYHLGSVNFEFLKTRSPDKTQLVKVKNMTVTRTIDIRWYN